MTSAELAWLAGLFEGEGSMYVAKNGGTRLTVRMCDRDVIDRVNAMFPCTSIQVVKPKPAKAGYSQPQTQYAWRLSNPTKVAEFLNLILPWLGERRTKAAQRVLTHLANRPGIGGHHRALTHCKNGHPFDEANTYFRPGTTHRRCRTCMRQWDLDSRAKKKARRG